MLQGITRMRVSGRMGGGACLFGLSFLSGLSGWSLFSHMQTNTGDERANHLNEFFFFVDEPWRATAEMLVRLSVLPENDAERAPWSFSLSTMAMLDTERVSMSRSCAPLPCLMLSPRRGVTVVNVLRRAIRLNRPCGGECACLCE
jgi:hypothetical protein